MELKDSWKLTDIIFIHRAQGCTNQGWIGIGPIHINVMSALVPVGNFVLAIAITSGNQ